MPQLWNILRGDIGFVGPRPPLRAICRAVSRISTPQVLKSRPGVTGLATLRYHRTEARLLAATASRAETDAVYARRCVPRKARLDLIYQKNRSLCFDLRLIGQTAGGLFAHVILGRKMKIAPARTTVWPQFLIATGNKSRNRAGGTYQDVTFSMSSSR